MKFMRRIYDWVLSWAESPYGTVALFILAMSESIFFPVPPDVLLIALAIGMRRKALFYGLVCLGGSVAGAMLGYLIGYSAWWTSAGEYSGFALFFFQILPGFTVERFVMIQHWYEQYNFWIIFTAGFTPIPYKIFTLTAGASAIDFTMFLIASIVSRGARFMLISALLYHFGKPINSFINRYFNLLAVVFTILLIGGFILLKFVFGH